MSLRAVLILARLTLLEAWRGRLPWLAVALAATATGLGAFAGSLAIVEARETGIAVAAAVLRLGAVFIIAIFVVASGSREFLDRSVESWLAQPISRGCYLAGRQAGLMALAGILAAAVGAPLAWHAPPGRVLAWSASLWLELCVVVAAGHFFVMSLAQVAALAATAGSYVLGRCMSTVQALAANGDPGRVADRLADWGVQTIAVLLPDLDRMTRTAWLIGTPPDASVLAEVAAPALIYVGLLHAAAAFDFHRREF